MTGGDAFDPRRIIEVLDQHEVDYVLLGGYAARLYGASRPTYDIAHERVIGSVRVKVAGLDDVIASKRAAGRPKDLDALPELIILARRDQDAEG